MLSAIDGTAAVGEEALVSFGVELRQTCVDGPHRGLLGYSLVESELENAALAWLDS